MFAPVAAEKDTIFAVATGAPPSAVAVFRISGSRCRELLVAMAGRETPPGRLVLVGLKHPDTGDLLDRGFVAWFPGPRSYTGEDYFELHVHGGRAVLAAVGAALDAGHRARAAIPGEFSQRAFLNGKMDLGALEGLADLISAQTEAQRRQSLAHSEGYLADKVDVWRRTLIGLLARAEAILDFPDESDAPDLFEQDFFRLADSLSSEFRAILSDNRGEIVREGFRVAIIGAPNVGKSSLLNFVAKRPAAIVTDVPGTTRDVIEVLIDLDGCPIRFFDTAGLRVTSDPVEQEGIARAKEVAASSDLVLSLSCGGIDSVLVQSGAPVLSVWTKADLHSPRAGFEYVVSVTTGLGLTDLLTGVAHWARASVVAKDQPVITRLRHRRSMEQALYSLEMVAPGIAPEICAEHLRNCIAGLDSLVGRVDTEEVLGDIFSQFCIGK